MNITFLIGNGFDLNLGLDTKYTDFIEDYTKDSPGDNDIIKQFKNEILTKKDLWAFAELAFGEYTEHYDGVERTIQDFCDCHTHFCCNLAEYLEDQQEDFIDLAPSEVGDIFVSAIKNLNYGFRSEPSNAIKKHINSIDGGFRFNFLSFNYTYTLEKCLLHAQKKIGTRSIGAARFENTIDSIHVHGYTNKDMVLGVNDETQIKNRKLFENCEPEYMDQIIKRRTNLANEENVDTYAHLLLGSSDLIYVYGMSIGETDAIWWERICNTMKIKPKTILILHDFDAPEEGLIRTNYNLYVKNKKQLFVNYSSLNDEEKQSIMKRIFVTRENLFHELKDMAKNKAAEEMKVG